MNLAIEDKFTAVLTKLSQWSVPKLLIYSFILDSIVMISFSLLGPPPEHSLEFESVPEKTFVVVFAGPLIETLIFQYAIIEYAKKHLNSFLAALLISSIVFGLFHHYSLHYVFATFFSGLIMGGLYIILKIKNSYPFLFVLLLHTSYNLLSMILNLIFFKHS